MSQNCENNQVVIDVKNVSMAFNMASQSLGSLKEYIIAFARRELMFKEFRALNNVSFQVKKGDVYGILGTNGSGKSTLLKIISGVLTPSEGSVTVSGKIAPLIEMTAGFDIELTGRENIYLNGSLLGYSRDYIDQHFNEIVDFAEIDGFLDIPLKNYSSGMVSRIAFAIATVMVPDILIVDEVLAVGDFMFQEKCEARIQSLIHDYGVTVLLVSHSIAQIERLCNKAIWIEKSRPRMMGTTIEVAESYKALGGQDASPEADRVIADLAKTDVDVAGISMRTIASVDRFETAVELIKQCDFEQTDNIVLSNGSNVLDRIVALGVAGALRAPLLFIHENAVPDSVMQTIHNMNPGRLIVLSSSDAGNGISKAAVRQLKRRYASSHDAEVIYLTSNSISALTQTAQRFLNNEGTDYTLVKASVNQEVDLVTLSSVLYKNALLTVFYSDEAESHDKLADVPELVTEQDSRVQSNYGALSEYDNVLSRFAEGVKTVAGEDEVEFVLVSAHDPSDSISSAIYVAQHGANMLQLQKGRADSIAAAAEFMQNFPHAISRLTFIGNSYCFSEMDKLALQKAAALNVNINREQKRTSDAG